MANVDIVRRGSAQPAVARRPWDPFERMRDMLMRDFFSLDPLSSLERGWGGGLHELYEPAFDVRETKDAYVIKADLPGMKEKDVDVSLTGNRLTVSGKHEAESTDESDSYYCRERSYGSFMRSFTLPDSVDADRIGAEMRDGVLTLTVPKNPKSQPRKIELTTARGNGGNPDDDGGAGEGATEQGGGTQPRGQRRER
jgi:HSP20 family protein